MWVNWAGGMWDLFIIYGQKWSSTLIVWQTKLEKYDLIMGQRE